MNPHLVTHDLLPQYSVNTWHFLTSEQTLYLGHQSHLSLTLLLLRRIQSLVLCYNGERVSMILNTSCEHVVSVFDKPEECFSDASVGFSHITLCTLHLSGQAPTQILCASRLNRHRLFTPRLQPKTHSERVISIYLCYSPLIR